MVSAVENRKKKKKFSIHLAERSSPRKRSPLITNDKSPNHRGTTHEVDPTNYIPHSTTQQKKKKTGRDRIRTTGFHKWIPRANKPNNREANEYTTNTPPLYGLVHSPVSSLSVEGDATLVLIKDPGPDRETTGTSSTRRAFSLYFNGTLPLQPGSRSVRSLEMR